MDRLGARTTRRALADAGAVEVALDEGPAWPVAGDEAPVGGDQPWVALLPALDPTTMGWKERAWYLPEHAVARRAEVRRRAEEMEEWVGDARYTGRCPGRVHARVSAGDPGSAAS